MEEDRATQQPVNGLKRSIRIGGIDCEGPSNDREIIPRQGFSPVGMRLVKGGGSQLNAARM